ncbi:MAG: LLM class flavin-dependent oxidoreductase [Chloroflexi bacterium]|nr:LLM class flavin-dependent oxidoreductase [Chloroflexota bacterium]
MPELALTIHPRPGQMRAVQDMARRAEEAGFTGVSTPEATMDSLIVSTLAATATKRIHISTAITNVYYRHPAICAPAVSHIHEVSGGRFILGLGTSHRLINGPRGIDMGAPISTMRNYVEQLHKFMPASGGPPIYLAALRKGMARLSGEVADGVLFNMVPLSRFPEAIAAVREGERKAKRGQHTRIASLLGACVSDDLEQAEAAGAAWAANDESAAIKAVDDPMVDELFIYGPRDRCLQRLDHWRSTGLELPIVSPRSLTGDVTQGFEDALKGLAPNASKQPATERKR